MRPTSASAKCCASSALERALLLEAAHLDEHGHEPVALRDAARQLAQEERLARPEVARISANLRSAVTTSSCRLSSALVVAVGLWPARLISAGCST